MNSHTLDSRKVLAVAISAMLASVALAQGSAPAPAPAANDVRALNPQPLPPKESLRVPPNNALNALNPQPLPPKERAVLNITSLRETTKLRPETWVRFQGQELTMKALREKLVISASNAAAANSTTTKISLSPDVLSPLNELTPPTNPVKDALDRRGVYSGPGGRMPPPSPPPPPPIRWVSHDLPKERWKNTRCDRSESSFSTGSSRHEQNDCFGTDLADAQGTAKDLLRMLSDRVSGRVSQFYYGRTASSGARPGGVHTRWDGTQFEKANGTDVYELRINPRCRVETWWTTAYETSRAAAEYTSPGVIRATVTWNTDRCYSAKSTFLGATVDEDYSCFSMYFNSKTTATCPEGAVP